MPLAKLSEVASGGFFLEPPSESTLREWCKDADTPIGRAAEKIRGRWWIDTDKLKLEDTELMGRLTG